MKKNIYNALLLLFMIAGVSLAQDTPPDNPPDAPAGPKAHKINFGVMGTVEEALDLDVNNLIFKVNWDDIEPEKGKYDTKTIDEVLKKIGKKEITVTCVLTGSTLWGTSAEKIDEQKEWRLYPPKAEFYATLAETVSVLAEKYAGKIKFWGIWDRPDSEKQWLPQPDAKVYAAMLNACKDAMSKGKSGSKLIAGPFKEAVTQDGNSLTKTPFVLAVNEQNSMKDIGGMVYTASSVDGDEGMNTYQLGAQISATSKNLVSIPVLGARFASKDKNGKSVKLDQESNVVKSYLNAFAGGAEILYCPVSEPSGTDETESIGLVSGTSKRQAYNVFRDFVKEFDGLEFHSLAPCAERNVKAFVFKKGDSDFILALWTNKEFLNQFKDKKAYVSIGFQYPDTIKSVTTKDMDNKKETYKQRNGFVSFAVSEKPLLAYIPTTSIDIVMGQVDRFDPDYVPAWTQKNVIVNPGKWKPPAKPGGAKPGVPKPGGGAKPGGGKGGKK